MKYADAPWLEYIGIPCWETDDGWAKLKEDTPEWIKEEYEKYKKEETESGIFRE